VWLLKTLSFASASQVGADAVVHFMNYVAEELRELMAQLGFRSIPEMVGRVDKLEMRAAIDHWKAKGLDYSKILYRPDVGPKSAPTARWIKTISSTVRSI